MKTRKTEVTEKNIAKFSHDTRKFGGYVYTSNNKLSSIIANEYQTTNSLRLGKIKNKSVIDVGCGDGTYTLQLLLMGKPSSILGIDPSREAIKEANKKKKNKKLRFIVGNIYHLPKTNKFDVAIVRGVLHHLYQPRSAFPELRVAKKVLIIEPNGNNMILKLIEKISRYHIEHEEKSYNSWQINKWIMQNNGVILRKSFRGLVPFFAPNWLAKSLKILEPVVEKIPIVNSLFCANYYVVYENK